jgi:hypothetical protein
LLSEEDRFRKLGVMLKTARKVWEAQKRKKAEGEGM